MEIVYLAAPAIGSFLSWLLTSANQGASLISQIRSLSQGKEDSPLIQLASTSIQKEKIKRLYSAISISTPLARSLAIKRRNFLVIQGLVILVFGAVIWIPIYISYVKSSEYLLFYGLIAGVVGILLGFYPKLTGGLFLPLAQSDGQSLESVDLFVKAKKIKQGAISLGKSSYYRFKLTQPETEFLSQFVITTKTLNQVESELLLSELTIGQQGLQKAFKDYIINHISRSIRHQYSYLKLSEEEPTANQLVQSVLPTINKLGYDGLMVELEQDLNIIINDDVINSFENKEINSYLLETRLSNWAPLRES